jgi:hypothetical protein
MWRMAEPKSNLDVKAFGIISHKRTGKTATEMLGAINLPELNVVKGREEFACDSKAGG